MDWDFFICHASEDKEVIARSLANILVSKGYNVWYDEFTLTLGDSLRQSINRGLAESKYGIVILSPDFFSKDWPQKELDGLFAREINGGKIILPVWHNVTREEIIRFSPIMADKVGAETSKGLEYVVNQIRRAADIKIVRIPTELEAREFIPNAWHKVYPYSDIASIRLSAEVFPETWPVGILIVSYYDRSDWNKGTLDSTHQCTPKLGCYLMVKSQGGILYVTWGVPNLYIEKDYVTAKRRLNVGSDGSTRFLQIWKDDALWEKNDIWNEAFWLDNFYKIKEERMKNSK